MFHFKTDASGQVTEDPDSEFDHWLDALRYPMTMLFSKSSIILSNSEMDLDRSSIVDKQGNFYRTPTPAEYAAAMGLPLNPEQNVDTVKLGKIGSISQLEKEDDEVGGDGSFLWSL
jgi:hypothetical protein